MKNAIRLFGIIAVIGFGMTACDNPTNNNRRGETPVITITTQPVSGVSVTFGAITGNLSVVASVTENATLSYRWQRQDSGNWVNVGTNSDTFQIPTDLAIGDHVFRVIVSATGRAVAVTSNTATITVTAYVPGVPPLINPFVGTWVGVIFDEEFDEYVHVEFMIIEDGTFTFYASYPLPGGTYTLDGNTINFVFIGNIPPPPIGSNISVTLVGDAFLFWGIEFRKGSPLFRYNGVWESNEFRARMIIMGNDYNDEGTVATLQLRVDESSSWENAAAGILEIEGINVTLTYTHLWTNNDWCDDPVALAATFGPEGVLGESNPMTGIVTGSSVGSTIFGHMVKQ